MSDLRQNLIRSLAENGVRPQLVDEAVRPQRLSLFAYEAYSLPIYGGRPHTKLLEPLKAGSLNEALAETTGRWLFDRGDRLAVREIAQGIDRLHIYAVRRKSHGFRVWNGHVPSTEHERWLDHICTIDLNIVAGIDVIGVGSERDIFEHRQGQRPEGARLGKAGQ